MHRRKEPTDESVVRRTFERAKEIPLFDREMMGPYALVNLAIRTGFRPKGLMLLDMGNVGVGDDGRYMLSM